MYKRQPENQLRLPTAADPIIYDPVDAQDRVFQGAHAPRYWHVIGNPGQHRDMTLAEYYRVIKYFNRRDFAHLIALEPAPSAPYNLHLHAFVVAPHNFFGQGAERHEAAQITKHVLKVLGWVIEKPTKPVGWHDDDNAPDGQLWSAPKTAVQTRALLTPEHLQHVRAYVHKTKGNVRHRLHGKHVNGVAYEAEVDDYLLQARSASSMHPHVPSICCADHDHTVILCRAWINMTSTACSSLLPHFGSTFGAGASFRSRSFVTLAAPSLTWPWQTFHQRATCRYSAHRAQFQAGQEYDITYVLSRMLETGRYRLSGEFAFQQLSYVRMTAFWNIMLRQDIIARQPDAPYNQVAIGPHMVHALLFGNTSPNLAHLAPPNVGQTTMEVPSRLNEVANIGTPPVRYTGEPPLHAMAPFPPP